MREKRTAILIILFILYVAFNAKIIIGKPLSKKTINYQITLIFNADQQALKVKVSFTGNESGKTEIKLPNRFASVNELYNQIKNLKLVTENLALEDTSKPEIKLIKHKPNEEIQLFYEIEQKDNSVTRAGRAGGYSPIFQKNYMHFIGEGVWIAPNTDEETTLNIELEWREIPKGWELANSFGVNKLKQEFRTSLPKFTSAVFVAGDYRIKETFVNRKPVYTALRGDWKFTDEEFSNLVNKIVKGQRDFWQDYDHPFYLVTLLPLEYETGRRSYGGTGLTNSFATFVTDNIPTEDLEWLIAHEYFHNWNYLSFGGFEEPQELLYWFSEGFTDYYTALLLKREGLYDFEQYIAKYNELTSDYYLSPVRNVDNERIRKDFFTDIKVTHQAYRRGFLLATKWNYVIQKQTNGQKSLDNVMRDILKGARKGDYKKLSKELIVSYLSKYAKYDFAGDIEKYVEKGETIGDFENTLGKCVDVSISKIGTFELGWDFEASKKNDWKLVGVSENSAAYKNGLRNGQQVAGLQLNSGNTSQPIKINIIDEGVKKDISYLPISEEKIRVPQFKLKNGLTELQKSECLKV